ncbi:hypothetical protein EJ08DRAFT_599542 [Tothia fuscella]|uniref:Uncharacterized protein n=1 Tax=Tothia fuscella TaxID=1048955 RepID=A0A9P4NFD0_9PEZI|nr:hypothetical protein EJ08DRAFT_599542 [Tothia fuscella]
MALPLHIHPCVCIPVHENHPPPSDKPLRIQIQGPLESVQKLVPDATWHTKNFVYKFPQSAGPRLAKITSQALYGQETSQRQEPIVRDEYLAWVMEDRRPKDYIDYYGVTFDHLVPADDLDPEVLAISIIEVDHDDGAFADEVLPFKIVPTEYAGKQVLAVPRCCQIKKGSQDRRRINTLVIERDEKMRGNGLST